MPLSFEEFKGEIENMLSMSEMKKMGWSFGDKSKEFCVLKSTFQTESKILEQQQQKIGNLMTIEYHIVYHQVYKEPVLYFRIFDEENNKFVTNFESGLSIVNYLRKSVFPDQKIDENDRSFISQGQHPNLGIFSFFFLHPCQTTSVMNVISATSKGYILSWLSVFGPLLGLQLPKIQLIGDALRKKTEN